jgi:hypothetical protein
MDPVHSIVVGIAVGVASAYATAWLAFRRFQKERLWERKQEAYVRVLTALHDMDITGRRIIRDMEEGKEKNKKDYERYKIALEEEIGSAYNVGQLLLPESATKMVQQFREKHREISQSDDEELEQLLVERIREEHRKIPESLESKELARRYRAKDLIRSLIDEFVRVAQKDLLSP